MARAWSWKAAQGGRRGGEERPSGWASLGVETGSPLPYPCAVGPVLLLPRPHACAVHAPVHRHVMNELLDTERAYVEELLSVLEVSRAAGGGAHSPVASLGDCCLEMPVRVHGEPEALRPRGSAALPRPCVRQQGRAERERSARTEASAAQSHWCAAHLWPSQASDSAGDAQECAAPLMESPGTRQSRVRGRLGRLGRGLPGPSVPDGDLEADGSRRSSSCRCTDAVQALHVNFNKKARGWREPTLGAACDPRCAVALFRGPAQRQPRSSSSPVHPCLSASAGLVLVLTSALPRRATRLRWRIL